MDSILKGIGLGLGVVLLAAAQQHGAAWYSHSVRATHPAAIGQPYNARAFFQPSIDGQVPSRSRDADLIGRQRMAADAMRHRMDEQLRKAVMSRQIYPAPANSQMRAAQNAYPPQPRIINVP
jgi:hypothetical protein